ncbi:MAG: DUF2344 domain-containing protein [Chloroflexi bacterium]|nr:DUF2344 domain-containing protein [Chloroflexota bacterium]
MNQALTQQRIRIQFGKSGFLRFVGHLDLAQTWERILRRAGIPLEYSQGFNPRPRMQFAAALPVGVTSESEFLDAWLLHKLEGDFPAEWVARLAATCPSGLVVYTISDVPIRDPALPTRVTSAEYVLSPLDAALGANMLRERALEILAADHIERVRHNKKPYDLRPLILDLKLDRDGNLLAYLKTGDGGNGRPDELVDALGFKLAQVSVHRRRLFLGDE